MEKETIEIPEYNNYYITRDGNVISYDKYHKKTVVLKQRLDHNGYPIVNLWKDGKQKTFKVHRLVANAFIPNLNNLPQINHIDENKQNNNVTNLEWCDARYNTTYGTRLDRIAKYHRKKVYCIELDREFASLKEASDYTHSDRNRISMCCNGILNSNKGYHWEWRML